MEEILEWHLYGQNAKKCQNFKKTRSFFINLNRISLQFVVIFGDFFNGTLTKLSFITRCTVGIPYHFLELARFLMFNFTVVILWIKVIVWIKCVRTLTGKIYFEFLVRVHTLACEIGEGYKSWNKGSCGAPVLWMFLKDWS